MRARSGSSETRSCAGAPASGRRETSLELVEAAEHVLDAGLRPRRRVEGALRLEDDALDVVERQALPAQADEELLTRDRLAPERSLVDAAVLVQGGRAALQRLAEARAHEGAADEQGVGGEQDHRPEEPAGQGEVVPDDRVLDDVGEQQEDDEVERVE